MNLVSISTGKFFKDNKIARARRASAIRSLWKVYRGLLHQIAREIILLLVNNVYEKKITRSQDRRYFDSVLSLFVIRTRVTN